MNNSRATWYGQTFGWATAAVMILILGSLTVLYQQQEYVARRQILANQDQGLDRLRLILENQVVIQEQLLAIRRQVEEARTTTPAVEANQKALLELLKERKEP